MPLTRRACLIWSILKKILWFKESEVQKHLEDALWILEIQQNLDLDYLKIWADKLGIQGLLEGLQKRIPG